MNYPGILDNIIDLAYERLNSWERGFIDSMYAKIIVLEEEKKMTISEIILSDNEKTKIREIQDKYLKN